MQFKAFYSIVIVCTGGTSPGTIELELQYNNLNPLHPVLLVKLTDVVFYSPKGLSTGIHDSYTHCTTVMVSATVSDHYSRRTIKVFDWVVVVWIGWSLQPLQSC